MASTAKAMNNEKKSSFLLRQKNKSKEMVNEEELLLKADISPEDVLNLKKATKSQYLKLIDFC